MLLDDLVLGYTKQVYAFEGGTQFGIQVSKGIIYQSYNNNLIKYLHWQG